MTILNIFSDNRLLGIGIVLAMTFGFFIPSSLQASPIINEFSASTAGTDVEYIEIWGDPSTDYSAFTVLEIEGDSSSNAGVIDEVISIGTTDGSGLYLADLPANSLENGTITLLLVQAFSGSFGNDLDTNNDGIFDITPWSSIFDGVAVFDGGISDITYAVPVLYPNYDGLSPYTPGGASRIPNGQDTDTASDWIRNDFDLAGIPGYTGTWVVGEAYNTPGEFNAPDPTIPEPTSLLLLGTGLGILWLGTNRCKRK